MKNIAQFDVEILSVLKTFNTKEWKALTKFIHSGLYPLPADAEKLLEFLKKRIEEKTINNLNINQVIQAILTNKRKKNLGSNEEFSLKKKVHKLTWHLMQVLQKFLIHIELEKDDFTQNQLLLNSFTERKLTSLYEKKYKGSIKKNEKEEIKDQHYYLRNYSIHEHLYFNQYYSRFSINIPIQKELIDNLEHFYYMNKLRLGIEMYFLRNWENEEFFISGLDEAIAYGEKNPTYHFDMYNSILKLIISKQLKKDQFQTILNKFKEGLYLWNHRGKRLLVQYMSNYLIPYVNQSNKVAMQLQIDLFEIGFDNSILLDSNNTITNIAFINFFVLRVKLGHYDKARQFLINYEQYLKRLSRKDILNYCNAYLAMSKEEFENAIGFLHDTIKKSEDLDLISRTLRVRCLYELTLRDDSYYPPLVSQLNRFERFFIKNKVISKNRKEAYLNLIGALKLLNKIKQAKPHSSKKEKWLGDLNDLINDPARIMLMTHWVIEKKKEFE